MEIKKSLQQLIAASPQNVTAKSPNNIINRPEGMAAAPGCSPTVQPQMNERTVQRRMNGVGASILPQRKIIRAQFHDYSGGDYFVTICTRDKKHFFGKIIDGEMKYSAIGKEAVRCMDTLASHYSYVEVPVYVVMPNHVHAIICIREKSDAPGCIPTIRTALGVVVGGYKQAVTRFARRNNIEFGWQGRYHDHIIRGCNDGNKISEYIESNVARWENDCFYAE